MKFIKFIATSALLIASAMMLPSCNLDDSKDSESEAYQKWKELNDNYMTDVEKELNDEGKPKYTKVVPKWNTNAYVLMRWFNDTTLTRDNLRPLYTSTVDCKYIGRFYNDQPFDSSYLSVNPADSIFRTSLTKVIPGWTIAFERMHVGDSVEVIIPYSQGYGTQSSGSVPAYSTLKFNIRLVDVAGEYIRP